MGDDLGMILRRAEAPVGAIDEGTRDAALRALSNMLARPVVMRVRTTVVGSQPNQVACKLNRVRPGVFEPMAAVEPGTDFEILAEQQARENIVLQESWGTDILAEGELFRNDRRGSAYITYLAGACNGLRRIMPMAPPPVVPCQHPSVVIVDDIGWQGPFLLGDFVRAQRHSAKPVKISIPGPLSFSRRIMNVHYADWRDIGWAMSRVIAAEIRTLVAAGCRWIQIDEPHLSWESAECVALGMQWLAHLLPSAQGATTILHMCRSNPYGFTRTGSIAATTPYYSAVAPLVAALPVDVVSVEDPCVPGELGLAAFGDKRVMLGVLDVTRPEAESVDALVALGERAMGEVPVERLMFSPKCGMLHMPAEVATAKVANMVAAMNRLGG